MCFKKKIKIYQASKNGVYLDDDVITPKSNLEKILIDLLKTEVNKTSGWIDYGSLELSIKNITYLGFKLGEDRSMKKRAQFPIRLMDSFKTNPKNKIFIGYYINSKSEELFVIFNLNADKRGKNSSVHVNVSDLQNAFNVGGFSKIDRFKNKIIICSRTDLKSKLDSLNSGDDLDNFKQHILNASTKMWNAVSAYSEMNESNFKDRRQTEWPGFYVEFKAEKFFEGSKTMVVPGKKYGTYTSDAFSLKENKPIEFKFHSIENEGEFKGNIPGNDIDGITQAIKQHGSLILFVVTGVSKKESKKREVDVHRRMLFGLDESTTHEDKARLLKSEVKVDEVYLTELTLESLENLKKFSQGKNSNGNARKKKFMYSYSLFEHYEN